MASREFSELVRTIGESRSKQEEDRIIAKEVVVLKERFRSRDVTPRRMREFIVRALYIEMLGHDAEFSFIHAVNLTQQHTLHEKRVGYLGAQVMLDSSHELMLLMVNSLQRDIQSANILEASAALTALCRLANAETIPPLLGPVTNAVSHRSPLVRKKAVMALHRFWQVDASAVEHLEEKFKAALCDRDPSVMAASLAAFDELTAADAAPFKALVPSFVSILKQVGERRLPPDYEYHRIPAPWIQIKLMRLLSRLGHADQKASEEMYGVLRDTLRRADSAASMGPGSGGAIAFAVVYEAVRTVATIYPSHEVLADAAKTISKFVSSSKNNLKYLGVDALARIVLVNQKYAAEHQMVVIECLEDPDETLKRKTLDLLYKMTNPKNASFIVKKLLTYLRSTVDVYLRRDLVSRVTQLAERFAPSPSWFIDTVNSVFELGGSLVRDDVPHSLLRLLAEGEGESDEEDDALRRYAVQSYLDMIESRPVLEDTLVQVIAWTLGEYGYLSNESHSPEDIMYALVEVAERSLDRADTRLWIIDALAKIVAQVGAAPDAVRELFTKYGQSRDVALQQRCQEALALCARIPCTQHVLPVDASCEDIEVDPSLSFLNAYVQQAVNAGARQYVPPERRADELIPTVERRVLSGRAGDDGGDGKHKLRFEAYAAPQRVGAAKVASVTVPGVDMSRYGGTSDQSSAASSSNASAAATLASPSATASGLRAAGARKRWGAGGLQGGATPEPAPAPAPAPARDPLPSTGQQGSSSISSHSASARGSESGLSPLYGLRSGNDRGAGGSQAGGFSRAENHSRAPRREPELTEEDRRRQQMAAQLFGGMDDDNSPQNSPKPVRGGAGRSSVGRSADQPRQQRARAPSAEVRSETANPPSNIAPPSSQQQAGSSLLDLDIESNTDTGGGAMGDADGMGGASSKPALADLLSELGGELPGNQGASGAGSASGPSMGALDLLSADDDANAPMSDGVLEAAPSALTPRQRRFSFGNPKLDALVGEGSEGAPIVSLPLPVAQEIGGHPTDEPSPTLVASDRTVQVMVQKAFKPAELLLVVAVRNKSETKAVETCQIVFDPPTSIRVQYLPASAADVRGNRIAFSDIAPQETVFVAVKATVISYGGLRDVGVRVAARAQGDQERQVTTCVRLGAGDVIRPLMINTARFAEMWGELQAEAQSTLQGGAVDSTHEYMARATRLLHLHAVETIGMECIAAGQCITTNAPCLVHARLGAGRMDVLVRTPDRALSTALLEHCQRAFA